MKKFKGKGVYGAVAIGKAQVLSHSTQKVEKIQITDTDAEILRVKSAVDKAISELDGVYNQALYEVGEASAQIFEIHKLMLQDEDYLDSIFNIIRSEQVNAEYAVSLTAVSFADMLLAMPDTYMQARATDIKDISSRLISCLKGEQGSRSELEGATIICADDLTPSETVLLDKSRVLAFLIAHGSLTSHTAILARNLGIPAIIGLGDEFLGSVRDGDSIALDGYSAEVIINPDEPTLEALRQRMYADIEKRERLFALRGEQSVTLDGKRARLYANIGGLESIDDVIINDAEGIGLFRSEFLYLEGDDFPSEEHQLSVYKQLLERMGERLVIIRTLDIGADKQAPYFTLPSEENPALGVRGIRVSLTMPEMFKTQLRALYRASIYGRLGIMFPMITSVSEVERILDIIKEVKRELDDKGQTYSRDVEVGIMIETPASAIISDRLAPLVDFFSVGTNDLTQYTLACDRQNQGLDDFCDTHHEAVLRLIEMAAKSAHQNGKWIGICGELASDISLTESFLRMGIDELSVSPPFVLRLRETIRRLDLSK